MEGIAAGLLLNALKLEFGRDYRDDKEFKLIMIGADQEDTEDTPAEMATALVGCSVKNYTVPTGKKVIPLKLMARKRLAGTDKAVKVSVTETATAKIDIDILEGQQEAVEKYPFSDHVFVAGKVIKLYLTSVSGAVGVFVGAKFFGIEVDA